MSSALLDSARRVIRILHYRIRTEQSYLSWIKQYTLYHGKRHPRDMSVVEVDEFPGYLARDRNVACATQSQALNTLNFLYKRVLNQPPENSREQPGQSVQNGCRWYSL